MKYAMIGFVAYAAAACSVLAHSTTDHDGQASPMTLAAIEKNQVRIWEQGGYRYIDSNGIPNHQTGQFPNRNNPNTIREQQYSYRVPSYPKATGYITEMRGQPFGVALNGIPFDPGTAECWGQPRGGRPGTHCTWREEAIVHGHGKLGLDNSNAHVQPNGAYHYHGIPYGLLAHLGQDDLTPVGYAADGFKIYVSRSQRYRPSYQLKAGQRPDGPGGQYDGTYTQDFHYVAHSGQLDECNGMYLGNEYVYMLTTQFPYVPRCWKGTPDNSFARRRGPGPGDGRPPPPFHTPY